MKNKKQMEVLDENRFDCRVMTLWFRVSCLAFSSLIAIHMVLVLSNPNENATLLGKVIFLSAHISFISCGLWSSGILTDRIHPVGGLWVSGVFLFLVIQGAAIMAVGGSYKPPGIIIAVQILMISFSLSLLASSLFLNYTKSCKRS